MTGKSSSWVCGITTLVVLCGAGNCPAETVTFTFPVPGLPPPSPAGFITGASQLPGSNTVTFSSQLVAINPAPSVTGDRDRFNEILELLLLSAATRELILAGVVLEFIRLVEPQGTGTEVRTGTLRVGITAPDGFLISGVSVNLQGFYFTENELFANGEADATGTFAFAGLPPVNIAINPSPAPVPGLGAELLTPFTGFASITPPQPVRADIAVIDLQLSVSDPGFGDAFSVSALNSIQVSATLVPAPVPEPSVATLVGGAALAGLVYGWRRRKRAAASNCP